MLEELTITATKTLLYIFWLTITTIIITATIHLTTKPKQ